MLLKTIVHVTTVNHVTNVAVYEHCKASKYEIEIEDVRILTTEDHKDKR